MLSVDVHTHTHAHSALISVPQGKLAGQRAEAEKLASEHPEQAEETRARLADMEEVWEELCGTMKKREEGLGEASKLQGFLRHLDDFQAWLSRTQTAVASEDTPTSLAEAEQLLAQHDAIKNEVDDYRDDYERIKATGAEVRANRDLSRTSIR